MIFSVCTRSCVLLRVPSYNGSLESISVWKIFHTSYIYMDGHLKNIIVRTYISDMYQRLFLPVCVRVCLFRSKVSLNPFPQKVQRYLFVSLWHFIWRLRSLCSVKVFAQIRQANLDGSDSHRSGGSFSKCLLSTGASEAIGFLIPWPPFINSRGASGGIPYWNKKN